MGLIKNYCRIVCPKRSWLKPVLIIFGLILFLALCFLSTAYVYSKIYGKNNKVYSGIYIGEYHVGNLKKDELKEFVEKLNNKLGREGIDFLVEDSDGKKNNIKINTLVVSPDSSVELILFNTDELIEKVLSIGRDGTRWENLWKPLYFRFFSNQFVKAPLLFDRLTLLDVLKSNFVKFSDEPHDANFSIKSIKPLDYDFIEERSGKEYDYKKILNSITDNLSVFLFEEITVYPFEIIPTVFKEDLNLTLDKLNEIFNYGNIGINYINPQTKYRHDWSIIPVEFKDWIEVIKNDDDEFVVGLNEENLQKYLKVVKDYVNKPAVDAKFEMLDNKVVKFQASSSGVNLDLEKTAEKVNTAFLERNYKTENITKTITVEVEVLEPKIKVSDVNDLGIAEIVGVGISTFRDSHNNRIKNIANAVKRLNGVLIQSDEEFSTNKYAGPYTLENGYLPEAVIKGNEIKDEVGGGMCQIGTTMFRMAMNSGFDVTERRNHSLVVSYYSDPVNGNPGTDASLYEPFLDLKFLNDTGHHLLLQTEIDYDRQELRFIIWGNPDGRKGWYTHPKVLKWIPVGEEVITETEDLDPGVRKCQSAFTGAVAEFTYSRVTPDGEKIDRIFESHYRPLPKQCLVGIDPDAVKECVEGEECIVEDGGDTQINTSTLE